MRAEGLRRLAWPLLLLGGALAIGVVAMVADALGDHCGDVLFSGQASIPALVAQNSTGILLLLVAKALAYAISLSCGFRGGPIFPALFLGVGLARFAVVWFGMSPTAAMSVGAAAGMAGQARLLLASIVFATLLVGTAASTPCRRRCSRPPPPGSRPRRSTGLPGPPAGRPGEGCGWVACGPTHLEGSCWTTRTASCS